LLIHKNKGDNIEHIWSLKKRSSRKKVRSKSSTRVSHCSV